MSMTHPTSPPEVTPSPLASASQHPADAGFTLIEMLVVVLLALVLAAIAAPSWFGFMMNQRTSAVRNEVLQTLREAQTTARTKNQNLVVLLDVNSDPARIAISASTSTTTAQWRVLGGGTLQRGMVVFTPAPTPAPASGITSIGFNSDGTICSRMGCPSATSAALTFPLRINVQAPNAPNSRRCVIIDTLLGAMREERGTGSQQCS